MTAGWITLDSTVNDYLDESEQGIHKYAKCYNLAVRAMDKLGIDFFYQVRSVSLPILANKTAALPSDMVQWSKMGAFDGAGNVIPFSYNSRISSFGALQPRRIGQNSTVSTGGLIDKYDAGSSVFYNYWDGGAISNIYGIPGGSPFIGSFKFDLDNNVILFDQHFGYTNVCLEYIAAPNEQNTYYIPIQFREAIISFLRWMDIASLPPSRRGGVGDKQQRKREFYNDRRLAIASFKPLRLDEEYIWSLASQRWCVKS